MGGYGIRKGCERGRGSGVEADGPGGVNYVRYEPRPSTLRELGDMPRPATIYAEILLHSAVTLRE